MSFPIALDVHGSTGVEIEGEVHFKDERHDAGRPRCAFEYDGLVWLSTTNPHKVTCRRCLALVDLDAHPHGVVQKDA